MNYPKKLLEIANNIKKQGQNINIWVDKTESIDRFVNQQSTHGKKQKSAVNFKEEMLNDEGFFFSSAQERKILYLFSAALKWEWIGMEAGFLNGGFAFRGMLDVITFPSNEDFQKSLKIYNEYEQNTPEEKQLIEQLRWFETYEYPRTNKKIPVYACILYEKGQFPNTFYFYSNGLVYLLPFTTFDEYIDAMIAACGVSYWQYFYIDPSLLIEQNNHKNYITHAFHFNSLLDKKARRLNYDPSVEVDRLDLIHEYLERCVKYLPSIFPFADFSHHQAHYQTFKTLYEAARKK